MQTRLRTGCRWVPLVVKGDERGSLVVIEETRTVEWAVQRVYYLFGTQPGVTRGLHAHRRLEQFVVAVSGSCTMLLDDGRESETLILDDPAQGLMLPPMVWHEMSDFSQDCVLLVLAAAFYDEADYIRDRGEFLRLVSESRG